MTEILTCACGCGEDVKPGRKFRHGHNGRRSLTERFWEKVDQSGDCWIWTGSITTAGYGHIRIGDGEYDYSHRIAYRLLVGPIPDGMELDHLCRNRACCNPDHLEPVEHIENMRRGAGVFEFTGRCLSGRHLITSENDYRLVRGGRRCRGCDHEDNLARYALTKAAAAALGMKVSHYISTYGGSQKAAEKTLSEVSA